MSLTILVMVSGFFLKKKKKAFFFPYKKCPKISLLDLGCLVTVTAIYINILKRS